MSRFVCWLFVVAACGTSSSPSSSSSSSPSPSPVSPSPSSAPSSPPIANDVGDDRPDLPAVTLYGGGSTAVAQWGTNQACNLGILSAATPVAAVTYKPAELHLHTDTPCGPVAVFDGAVYFVESGRVARWADGATTTVMKTAGRVWNIELVAVNKSLVYIFVVDVLGVAVSRFDGTTLRPVTKLSMVGVDSPVVVGDRVVVASNALLAIHEAKVTNLRELKTGEELPRVVGATATEVALCERGVLQFLPLQGAPRVTTRSCGTTDLVVADSMFTPTFPPPATLVETTLTTGERRVLATSKREISDVVVTTDWIYYVESAGPGADLHTAGRIARVARR